MTTLEAPAITPCPVDWCPANGQHQRPADGEARVHRLSTLDFISDTGEREQLVGVISADDTDGTSQTMVILFDGYAQILDRQEAEQLVDAIHRAADLAFGPELDTFGPERAELDAAVAEVAMRADHPEDVNRLIAAAIRLRQAAAVLAEVER